MTSVLLFELLTLPKTSNGFVSKKSTVLDTLHEGSASPPRKIPRLDTDSDSASASRSHLAAGKQTGPIRIQIAGDYVERAKSNAAAHLALVCHSITAILTRGRTHSDLPASYEKIYNSCRFVVCHTDDGVNVYSKLKIELESLVGRLAKELTESGEEAVSWISQFVEVCQWFETQVALLQSVLTYLNQTYVHANKDILPIKDLAFGFFVHRIFENQTIAKRLEVGVETWVQKEREIRLEHEQRSCIPQLVAHLPTHGQYPAFEEFYMANTISFYQQESQERADALKNDGLAFFKHVRLRIEEEVQRAKAVLPPGSWSGVQRITEKALLGGRLEWLANESPLIELKNFETMTVLYQLFSRLDGRNVLCAAFKTHVQTSVAKIVKDQALDDNMVQRLLDFKADATKTISSSFLVDTVQTTSLLSSTSALPPQHPDQDFTYALGDAFTAGFKARRNKPAEMIAKYLDKAMRRGQGTSSDKAFEELLDSVLGLYRFTDDKDVFRTFHHRQLAKRLLLGKSASDDFEAAMLKKLKEQYDPEFGMGEEMFKDLALSREMMREYHSKLPEKSEGHKFSAMVLQRSAWPFSVQKHGVDLPLNMQYELTAFNDFYKLKHSAHVLDWDHALGTVTMTSRFKPGTKELSLSLYQAIVLLLFNDSDQLQFSDIKDQTRMEDGELRRTLQSLACGKKKVLKKVPAGKDVNDGDAFRVNVDFDDPRAKVHINSIQAKVTPEESKRTQVSIEGDRKHYLDAAIVRIMKARKEMSYEQLKTATIEAVKGHFVPQVDAIKKRIDALVETEYLERSKEDKNMFLYVA